MSEICFRMTSVYHPFQQTFSYIDTVSVCGAGFCCLSKYGKGLFGESE